MLLKDRVYLALRDLADRHSYTILRDVKGKGIKYVDTAGNYWYDADTIADRAKLDPDVTRSVLESLVVNDYLITKSYYDRRVAVDPNDYVKCYQVNSNKFFQMEKEYEFEGNFEGWIKRLKR